MVPLRAPAFLLLAFLIAPALAGCLSGPGQTSGDEEGPFRVKGTSVVAPGSFSVFPGDYKFDGTWAQPLTVGTYPVLPMEQVFLASALDGADIDMAIWRPETPDDVKVPIIIQASPYYSTASAQAGVAPQMIEFFVPHGYAYVQLAIRSTGNSGGCDDFRGPKMTADMSQAIDHLAGQAWSNGNVSLIGISYVGTTPWYAAGSGNAHVKTIVPISGSTNAWEVYNRNGTPESRSAIIIPNYVVGAWTNGARTTEHKLENMGCPDVYEAIAYGVSSGVVGDRFGPEWWQERNAKPQVEANYKGSILLVHGLEDWNVDPAVALPWADELNRSGLKVKQMLGQWAHAYPDARTSEDHKRWDWGEILLRWFDAELKGLDVDTGPPVQVQDNSLRWRDEASWPPRDAQWMRFNLTADGTLDPAKGSVAAEWTLAVPAQDAADFRLGPLADDLHIAGLPRVHVTVRPTAAGGNIGAFLYDEDPATGTLKRIGWTAMNLRFADGTETPQVVTPNQPLVAKMEIQPMDAVVPAGHNLVLRLWINSPSDRVFAQPIAPVVALAGGAVTSVLEIPTVDSPAGHFFTPQHPPAEA